MPERLELPPPDPEPPGIWIPENVRREMATPRPVGPVSYVWEGTISTVVESTCPLFEQPDGQWLPQFFGTPRPGLRVGVLGEAEGEVRSVGVVQEDGTIAYYDDQSV